VIYRVISCDVDWLKYYATTDDVSPTPTPKGAYGTFHLRPVASVFDKVAQRISPVISDVPLPFEDMDVNTGFVMYETTLTGEQRNVESPVNLSMDAVRDRAIIYLDQVRNNTVSLLPSPFRNASADAHAFRFITLFQAQIGTTSRLRGNTTVSLNVENRDQQLSILVENQGRINYGDFLEDRKVSVFSEICISRLRESTDCRET